MPLDSLLSLVEKLRERIDVHGDKLRQNEALTRYALIDPLLRELGWDTEDPGLVEPEYKTAEDGRPDYALSSNGELVMMVEAKKLGTPLQNKVLSKGLTYANSQGTNYFSVTDGERWEIYETFKPVPTAEKLIVRFDLKDGSAAEACLKALALWEIRVSGHVSTGQAPVVEPPHNQPGSPEPPAPRPTPPSPPGPEWQLISELKPQKGDTSPREVQFPDGKVRSVTAWRWLIIEVTRWLVAGNYLKISDCPIRKAPNSKRCAVSTEPVHLTETPFKNPAQVGSLYVETSLTNKGVINAARTIIKRVGQDPAQFKVRFSRKN